MGGTWDPGTGGRSDYVCGGGQRRGDLPIGFATWARRDGPGGLAVFGCPDAVGLSDMFAGAPKGSGLRPGARKGLRASVDGESARPTGEPDAALPTEVRRTAPYRAPQVPRDERVENVGPALTGGSPNETHTQIIRE